MLVGDRWTPPASARTALLLHGGGTSSANGFFELRAALYKNRIETLAFDCIGHGRTGGDQIGTTLKQRVQQVQAVLAAQRVEPSALTLVGFSMGAYVAVKAATESGVSRLCLAVPAAYARHAYETPFGPDFTQILRTPRSWSDSDAFSLTANYAGHLLVISAEQDQVIPAEIPERYAVTESRHATTTHYVVMGSGHKLNEHCSREPQAREAVCTQIALLCQRGDT